MTALPSNVTHKLDALLEAAVAKNRGRGEGIVAIHSLACGKIWESAHGAPWQAAPLPADPHDAFEVASITKTMTATLILRAIEAGRLRLETQLATLLPPERLSHLLRINGRERAGSITVEQLLSHRSGLPDHWTDGPFVHGHDNAFLREFMADANRDWTPDALLEHVTRLDPIGAPPTTYHYSDANYVILGIILERTYGKPLHQLLREELFLPIGMKDTYLSYRETAPTQVRLSHRYEDSLDLHGQRRQSADWASGGVVSTTDDLARFAAALSTGKLFASPATLAAMTAGKPTQGRDIAYGLGVFRLRWPGTRQETWGHDGHGNSFMYVDESLGLLWVGTLNQLSNDWWPMVTAMRAQVASAANELPRADRR